MTQQTTTMAALFKHGFDACKRERNVLILSAAAYGLIGTILIYPLLEFILLFLWDYENELDPPVISTSLIFFALGGAIINSILFFLFCIFWSRLVLGSPFAPFSGGARSLMKLSFRLFSQFIGVYCLALLAWLAIGSMLGFLASFVSEIVLFIIGSGIVFWILLSSSAVCHVLLGAQAYGRATEMREAFELIRDNGRFLTIIMAVLVLLNWLTSLVLSAFLTSALHDRLLSIISTALWLASGLIVSFAFIASLDALPQFQALKRKPPII